MKKSYLPNYLRGAGFLAAITIFSSANISAERILHVPMDLRTGGMIEETKSGRKLIVNGSRSPENIPGAVGKSLRFDGFSNFVKGTILTSGNLDKASFSIWVAPETYPIIKHDTKVNDRIILAGTLSPSTKKGWGFSLGQNGEYAFEAYSGGWKVEVIASDKLPVYEWSRLIAVCNSSDGKIVLYRNGTQVGEGRCMSISDTSETLYIGKGEENVTDGPFLLNTFNGLIDEIEVFDNILSADEIKTNKAENIADLSIPSSRFESERLRPVFHGMPGANWTNECHGMLYSGGRYHLFFQKNGNGPYMSRLHWGHISSENLYDWHEEKIAIMPGDSYDIKGCWSGHVFTDPVVGGGKPTAIYTAVDYARAVIASSTSNDENLINWSKNSNNPIINGRPSGLSDDFRDPFFFRNGEKAYIIVGSSKNGVGTTTLHEYDPVSGKWSNDGRLFFTGTSKAVAGEFWEMPNVTNMGNGKWLFTCTPLNTSAGVHTLYWIGSISSTGSFVPDKNSTVPRDIELISKQGYGLLSPTIYSHDGKTILIGIVPDKLSSQDNYHLGWAHNYSFPREISLDKTGNLIQKPFEGLRTLRSESLHDSFEGSLNTSKRIERVSGRRVELLGRFTIGSAPFGWRLFKNATGAAEVSYNPANNKLTVDLSSVNKLPNDVGQYDGIYECNLPERPAKGSEMTINVFADGSILDIFINDRWATSIRVFPTDNDADGIEIFAGGSTEVKADAWTLSSDAHPANIQLTEEDKMTANSYRYDLSGKKIKEPIPGEISVINGRLEVYTGY